MGVIMDRETRRKMLEEYLMTLEYGVEQDMRTLGDLINHLIDSIELWLPFNTTCREVKVLEHRVRGNKIDVTISCDGEAYRARWRYKRIIAAELEKVE
jgi:hypothetical protein